MAGFVSGLVISAFGGAAALGTVGVALVQLGTGLAFSAIARAAQKDDAQTQSGIVTQFTGRGDTSPQTIILGRYATAGHQIAPYYAHSSDPGSGSNYGTIGSGDYATFIINIADAPIERLVAFYVDGVRFDIQTDMDALHPKYGKAVNPTGGRSEWANHLWIFAYLGNQSSANTYLTEAYGAHPERPWKTTSVHEGGAYVVITLKRNDTLFRSIPQFRFEVEGLELEDPRTSVEAFTENAAILPYHVAKGITMPDGELFGIGAVADDLPDAWWHTAMDASELSVEKEDATFEEKYRAGLEVAIATPDDGGSDPLTVLDELLAASSGAFADLGGQLIVRVGGPSTSVLSISDDDILNSHSQSYNPFPSLSQKHNAIAATFPNPDAKWESTEAPPRFDAEAEAKDGRRLIANLDLKAVPFSDQVQRLMVAWLKDAQRRRVHTIVLSYKLDRVAVLDTIQLTSALHGYTNKLFEVLEYTPDLMTGSFQLSIREVDAADFTPNAADYQAQVIPQVSRTVAPALQLVGPTAAAHTITDGTNDRRPAIRLTWGLPSDLLSGVAWQIKRGSELVVEGSTSRPEALEAIVADNGILPNTSYTVLMRPLADGQLTEWSGTLSVTTGDVRLILDDLEAQIGSDIAQGISDAADVQVNLDAEVAALQVDYDAAEAAAGNAATAQAASEAARDAAQLSRNQAVDAAQDAELEAIFSSLHASAAEGHALAAEADAAAALVSEGAAALASSAAGASAAEAATQSEIAVSVVTSTLPEDFQAGGTYFTSDIVGAPDAVADSPATEVEYLTTTDGAIARIDLSDAGNKVIATKGVLPILVGRDYRITARVRQSGAGPIQDHLLQSRYLGDDYTSEGAPDTTYTPSALDTWETITHDFSPADAAELYVRPLLFSASTSGVTGHLEVLYIRVEDVTSEIEAEDAAAASVLAEASAGAHETAAGVEAAAAASQRLAADTARTGAEAAESGAVAAQGLSEGARDDAEDAEDAAVLAQSAAESARDQSVTAKNGAESAEAAASTSETNAANSESASAGSASAAASDAAIASTKAGEASTDAAAAATSELNASTDAGTASVKASEAAISATNADNSAIEAAADRVVTSRLLSGGVAGNPTFTEWDGAQPDGLFISATGGASFSKETALAKYKNAVRLTTSGPPTSNSPYVILASNVSENFDVDPETADLVKVTVNLEILSGAWGGCRVRVDWRGATHQQFNYYPHDEGDPDVVGVKQTIEFLAPRPDGYVAHGTAASNFMRVWVYGTSSASGGYVQNEILIDSLDFQVVAANSVAGITQQTKSTTDGWSSSYLGFQTAVVGAETVMSLYALNDDGVAVSGVTLATGTFLIDSDMTIFKNGVVQSDNYAETGGIPIAGWRLDGPNGTIKGKSVITSEMIEDGAIKLVSRLSPTAALLTTSHAADIFDWDTTTGAEVDADFDAFTQAGVSLPTDNPIRVSVTADVYTKSKAKLRLLFGVQGSSDGGVTWSDTLVAVTLDIEPWLTNLTDTYEGVRTISSGALPTYSKLRLVYRASSRPDLFPAAYSSISDVTLTLEQDRSV